MNVYICTGFRGIITDKTAAVICAYTYKQAQETMQQILEQHGLPKSEDLKISELCMDYACGILLNKGD